MNIPLKDYGLDLAVIGAIISCYGVVQLNIFMNPLAAMHVWMFSNLFMLGWSLGLWQKWWDGGLSGLALCVMYAFYTVSNFWGLTHV